jgi:hypothetical protein
MKLRVVAVAAMVLVLGGLAGCGRHVTVGDEAPAAVQTVTVTASPSQAGSTAPAPPSSAASSSTTPSAPTAPATPSSATAPADGLAVAPTTYAEAQAHIAAGRPAPGETVRFVSPTGGIYCALAVGEMEPACELTQTRLQPQPGSHLQCSMIRTIGRIELDATRAAPICNTDTIVTPGAPTLGYGEVATTRDTECVMEKIGVTCVGRNGQGAGFFLSAERYALFG